ncbi:MAG: hypothetical protein KDA87_25940, partial [Planctomycetales bacterium]|nr:hypothetical protein [Planctomycetales bacterium]
MGNAVNNGLTFRLDHDVSICYDLHRMRMAGVWQGGFLDLSETHHYRQRGERMPGIGGEELTGLDEWEWDLSGSFDLPPEAKPARGPVREDWMSYHGHYLHGEDAILSYSILDREVLEAVEVTEYEDRLAIIQTLHVEAGQRPLRVAVARIVGAESPRGTLDESRNQLEPLENASSNSVVMVSGVPNRRGLPKPNANRALHLIRSDGARSLDLGTPKRTVVVEFRTTNDGTLVASTPEEGPWKPDGKSLFVRGGRLVYDIGWVGAMTSSTKVDDGQWHLAALVVRADVTSMYIDGKVVAEKEGFRRDPVNGFVFKVGATATNFGGDFGGDIRSIRIFNQALDPSIAKLEKSDSSDDRNNPSILFSWNPTEENNWPQKDLPIAGQDWELGVAARLIDDTSNLQWSEDEVGRLVLTIPASESPQQFRLVRSIVSSPAEVAEFANWSRSLSQNQEIKLTSWITGGPLRWPELLRVSGQLGSSVNGYSLDTIPVPFQNPWNAWLRTSALDFFDDGRCVVTTHGGDVYVVSGLDDELKDVTWKRYAAGLFEPFGVRVVDGMIYVTCRDGLKRLHDFNNDGEADFIEAFWNDDDVSSSFHAYNFDLQTDSLGNFYFAKAGQYTQHHRPGTIMRVPPAGHHADVIAWGLRTPNGMGRLWDDRFTVSDNQGPWMPAGKVSLIRSDAFLGNMPINDEQTAWLKAKHGGELPSTFDEPIVWTP